MNSWEKQYQQLARFKEQYGHCRVPNTYVGENPKEKLGRWLVTQKMQYKRGELSQDAYDRLTKLGVKWSNCRDLDWDARYEQLKVYCQKYGHCCPSKLDVQCSDLGIWVLNQRASYRAGTLSEQRKERLDEIGFEWSLRKSNPHIRTEWDAQYLQLQRFVQRYGHCNVPISYRGDKQLGHLGNWVRNQRKTATEGLLLMERRKRLEKLGFCWNWEDIWEKQFQLLTEYKQLTGSANPLAQSSDEPKWHYLEEWVDKQRQAHRRHFLSSDKVKKMEELGVEWDFNRRWELQYRQLEKFYQQHRHSDVPIAYLGEPGMTALGTWVSNQRRAKKQGILSEQRIKKLNRLQFSWSCRTQNLNCQNAEEVTSC